MALDRRNIPIGRDTVVAWIEEWRRDRPDLDGLEGYLRERIADLKLPDEHVENFDGPPIHLADLIIDDLPSYGIRR